MIKMFMTLQPHAIKLSIGLKDDINHVVSNLPIALKVLCPIESLNFLYPSIMVGMILKSQNVLLSLKKWKL